MVQSEMHVQIQMQNCRLWQNCKHARGNIGGVLGRVLDSITLASIFRANARLASHINSFCPHRKVNAGGYVARYTGKELAYPRTM